MRLLIEQSSIDLSLLILIIIIAFIAFLALLLVVALLGLLLLLVLFLRLVALLVNVTSRCRFVVLEQCRVVFEQSTSTKNAIRLSADLFSFLLHFLFKFLLLALCLAHLPGHQGLVGDWCETLSGQLLALLFNFLFNSQLVGVFSLHKRLFQFFLFTLKNVPDGQGMSVNALVSVIWAFPEPSIKILLNSVEEMRTNNFCALGRLSTAVTRVSVNVNLR